MPIVINLFGAPGSGKSTAAAYVFSKLKMQGISCELITEYAKDKTWEGNQAALTCQEYIFGKQSYRMARCADKVDVIITDSPLPLGLLYNTDPALDENFTKVVLNVFNKYDNFNLLIKRTAPYEQTGRNQNEEESDKLYERLKTLFAIHNITHLPIEGSSENLDVIVNTIRLKVERMKEKDAPPAEVWALAYIEDDKPDVLGYVNSEDEALKWFYNEINSYYTNEEDRESEYEKARLCSWKGHYHTCSICEIFKLNPYKED